MKILKLKEPGRYEDGGGLRLIVGPTLKKRWVMRLTIDGKRRERGLGSFPAVSLDEARDKAAVLRKAATGGRDLATEQRRIRNANAVTFEDAFAAFFELRAQTLSNGKHVAQRRSTMATYAFPTIGSMPVGEVAATDILTVLQPIWFTKPETARRVLQRMEAVFKSAILRGHRTTASPCIGVSEELGTRHRVVKHHRSLPWQELPNFMVALRERAGHSMAALALEFLILTAMRSGEVRGAAREEFNFDSSLWRVPVERMKMRAAHEVPLTPQMRASLQNAKQFRHRDSLVFPGDTGEQLSDMALNELMRGMGYKGKAVPHGFRSTFKTWAAEHGIDDVVSEAVLAHAIPEKVRAAYLRTDFLNQRRQVMVDWNDFVMSAS